jgi:hypothetical protein
MNRIVISAEEMLEQLKPTFSKAVELAGYAKAQNWSEEETKNAVLLLHSYFTINDYN